MSNRLTLAALSLAALATASSALSAPYVLRLPVPGLAVRTAPPAPPPPGPGVLAATPQTLTFGGVALGASSGPQVLNLQNDGAGPLTVASLQFSPSNAGFTHTHNCSAALAPGQSCNVNVSFSPPAGGSHEATLSVQHNGSGGAREVALTGSGLQAAVTLAPVASSSFGSVLVGGSAQRSFTFTNAGPVGASSVAAAVTGTALTVSTNTCGTVGSPGVVASGANCTVTVTYAPVAPGALAGAALTITSNGLPATASLELSGTASDSETGTVALLHFDGANGSTSTTDVRGHAVSFSGTAALSTTRSVSGGASLWLQNGLGAVVLTPVGTEFQARTGDFTIEGWVYTVTVNGGANPILVSASAGHSNPTGFQLSLLPNGLLYGGSWGTAWVITPTALPTNQWVHIAASRNNGTIRLFVNGTLVSSGASTHDFTDNLFRIGNNGGYGYNGYVDEVRWTKGIGRYTANFTPAVRHNDQD